MVDAKFRADIESEMPVVTGLSLETEAEAFLLRNLTIL